jgi:two-component system, NarL family, response regulator NreC
MREGLRSIIEEQADLEVAGEAADGVMAVQATRGLRPDVVIMDVNMPKMNGLEATRQIKAEFPQMTVIGLSMHEDEKMAAPMLEAGASAYVSKGRTFEMLCATIRKMRAQECDV